MQKKTNIIKNLKYQLNNRWDGMRKGKERGNRKKSLYNVAKTKKKRTKDNKNLQSINCQLDSTRYTIIA
jgi:hypothetical protein